MTPEQEAAERADLGQPASALDFHGTGLYVPIIDFPDTGNWVRVRAGGSYPTRTEAEACAAEAIARQRAQLARDLAKPGRNYARAALGLPPLEEQAS